MPDTPSVEALAAELAASTRAEAVRLANETADKAAALAEKRNEDAYAAGARDALRDRTIDEHTRHLDEIGDSLLDIRKSIQEMEITLMETIEERKRERAVSEALTEYLRTIQNEGAVVQQVKFSRRQIQLGCAAVLVAIIMPLLITVLTHGRI